MQEVNNMENFIIGFIIGVLLYLIVYLYFRDKKVDEDMKRLEEERLRLFKEIIVIKMLIDKDKCKNIPDDVLERCKQPVANERM